MSIGKKIRTLRNEKGLTLKELAEKTTLSVSFISDIENERRNPSPENLELIADALGIHPGRITGDSVGAIIDKRLLELGMTKIEMLEKAGIPSSLYWLENIDTFVPGWGGSEDIGYKWVTKIAEVIGIPGSTLRAALAKQEAPVYHGYIPTAKEDFDFEEPTKNTKAIDTVAAHLAGKDITPKKLKLIEQYIDVLFEEDEGDK